MIINERWQHGRRLCLYSAFIFVLSIKLQCAIFDRNNTYLKNVFNTVGSNDCIKLLRFQNRLYHRTEKSIHRSALSLFLLLACVDIEVNPGHGQADKGFSIYQHNLRGLWNNKEVLEHFIKSEDLSIRFKNFIWSTPYKTKMKTKLAFKLTPVTVSEVFVKLKKLSFLKDVAIIIAKPLAHVINLSIATGFVPSGFKSGIIIPVYKSSPKNDMDNYRSITVLPICFKIFEQCICK